MTETETMNKLVKDGKVKITRPGLLSCDFETVDKSIVVTSKRIGGGFTMGETLYFIIENKETHRIELEDAYKKIIEYCG